MDMSNGVAREMMKIKFDVDKSILLTKQQAHEFNQDLLLLQYAQQHSRQKRRQITKINLLFDFTIESMAGATGEWFNEMASLDYIQPVDSSFLDLPTNSQKTIREALASLSVLPLFMIRFTGVNSKSITVYSFIFGVKL